MALERQEQKPIVIENLVVNPAERHELIAGDVGSLVRLCQDVPHLGALVWNEQEIVAFSPDFRTMVRFRPELNPSVSMFFMREEKREKLSPFGEVGGARVWEGDYEPVKFTKASLTKWLRTYAAKAEHRSELEKEMNLKHIFCEHTRRCEKLPPNQSKECRGCAYAEKKAWHLVRRPSIKFKLEDLWLGICWKKYYGDLQIWICLIPCFPIHIWLHRGHFRFEGGLSR